MVSGKGKAPIGRLVCLGQARAAYSAATATGSNSAHSKNTEFVPSSHPVASPPITPASPASAGTLATQILSVLGFYVVRLDNLVDTWQLMLAEQPDGVAPIARWIERHDEGGQPGDYMVCASPISGCSASARKCSAR